MVNRNLLRQFDLPENELEQELAAAFNQSVYEAGEVACAEGLTEGDVVAAGVLPHAPTTSARARHNVPLTAGYASFRWWWISTPPCAIVA